jgi:hypothetical protein
MTNDITKVNVSSDFPCRILTNSLKTNSIICFSYENKQNRYYILRRIKDQGLQAMNAIPKLKWKTKEPLDMFIV